MVVEPFSGVLWIYQRKVLVVAEGDRRRQLCGRTLLGVLLFYIIAARTGNECLPGSELSSKPVLDQRQRIALQQCLAQSGELPSRRRDGPIR